MDLVRSVSVPNDEFAILGGRDEVPPILCPVHGIYLCKVSPKRAAGLHDDSREWVNLCSHRTD